MTKQEKDFSDLSQKLLTTANRSESYLRYKRTKLIS